MRSFDPLGALERLIQHDVEFAIIGGLAARLRGSPTVTDDLDICHSTAEANLTRLASSLSSMHAILRGAEDVALPLGARLLRQSHNLAFSTDFGSLDCLAQPPGIAGHAQLLRNADSIKIDGVRIMIASFDDLMAMKRAAGRPKDLIELEVLGALRDELEAGRLRETR